MNLLLHVLYGVALFLAGYGFCEWQHWRDDRRAAEARKRVLPFVKPAAPGQPSVYDLNITGTIGGDAGKEPA